MKVLILSRDIPPYVDVPGATQRVVLFSHYLIQKGHEVTIVGSSRRVNDYNGPIWWEKYLNKVKIIPLLPGGLLKYIDFIKEKIKKKKSKEIYSYDLQINNDITKNKNRAKKRSFKNLTWGKIIYRLMRKVYNNFFIFGDDGILEIPSLKKHLNRIINDLKPDILILSTPPHSWLRIIPWLKNKYSSLPLIIDFRDGWTSTGLFTANNCVRRYWQDYIEKKVIRSSDGVVFISPALEKFYVSKYKVRLPISEVIYNGYNEKLWNNVKQEKVNTVFSIHKRRPCIIKYVGSISFSTKSFRSPYNIFLALESCLKKGIISSSDFILSFTGFIGNTEVLNDFPLLKKNIQINGTVSPLNALKEMKNADFLLLTHKKEEGAEEVLTGKIFDYLRAERPILAVTTNNCGIKIFLDNLGVGIWANINDINDISENIIDILKIFRSDKWHEWCEEKTSTLLQIEKYSREHQYEKFENFIEKIVKEENINQRSKT